jgi:hypothetical protein
MIHYKLNCANGHEFESWFKDSAAFDQQAKLGFLECPICGDGSVSRALMAPALVKPRAVAPAQIAAPPPATDTPAPAPAAPAAMTTAPIPAQVRAALQRLRAEVEKHCDYVGPAFPDMARRIHRGEIEQRGIYGEATPDQAETLAEEGIQIARIPWVPRADG